MYALKTKYRQDRCERRTDEFFLDMKKFIILEEHSGMQKIVFDPEDSGQMANTFFHDKETLIKA